MLIFYQQASSNEQMCNDVYSREEKVWQPLFSVKGGSECRFHGCQMLYELAYGTPGAHGAGSLEAQPQAS
ncbi:hypothetical protein PVAP13_3KG435301 [Panicum virgatum]|uniref:Uncharacterized protein n=1 Tax=Panicum virgatum TaxID=38727 RepID=A0A8T0V6Z5_PANVG|nr:hypothetical protein PVAP13_3KG435301 [Panicum virgatum]